MYKCAVKIRIRIYTYIYIRMHNLIYIYIYIRFRIHLMSALFQRTRVIHICIDVIPVFVESCVRAANEF